MRFGKHILCLLLAGVLLYLPSNVSFATGPTKATALKTENETVANQSDYLTQMAAAQLEAFYAFRHANKRDGFNGCVLVAKDGKAIFQGAFGYGNFKVKDTLTTQTSFQLASTSKTFTSAAILHLVEEGKLALDDSIQKFYPDFPYKNITVKLLLSHRSGLPEYITWGKKYIGKGVNFLTNQSLVEVLIKKKPKARFKPDKMFKYTNTNFALLAAIIENVSGQTYKQYLEETIFKPLGMNNTFVFSIDDTAHCGASCYLNKWQQWGLNFSDGVNGDKGIYSSVEDLLKWDNALKEGKIISIVMQREAYSPHNLDRYSFRGEPNRNYGYGWRILVQKDRSYTVYHNGNWHGCNNVFSRDLTNGYTIVVLSNKANEKNYRTQPILDMLYQMKNAQGIAQGDTNSTSNDGE